MSKIEWTDRSDWNPIRGCTRVSEGCRNCYAERIAARFSGPGQPFHGVAKRTDSGPRWTGNIKLIEERLDLPLRWRKPARIFVNSTYDLFHPAAPDEWIDQVFAVMALAPQHTFQILTKRPARMLDWFQSNPYERILGLADIIRASRPHLCSVGISDPNITPWPNVWLGVSVEDQATTDERIPLLLQTPAAVRFISAEPLLGPIGLARHFPHVHGMRNDRFWVIAGGESGPGARPSHIDWFRSLRDQCQAAGVAFFFKQWGSWTPEDCMCQMQWRPHFMVSAPTPGKPGVMFRCGKRAAGRLLDGREWSEYPVTDP